MGGKTKLGFRLMAGFSIVALITLALGAFGYLSASRSQKAINEIGRDRLPALDSLLLITSSAENMNASIRTLAIPGLSADERRNQYTALRSGKEKADQGMANYEVLHKTKEEEEAWVKLKNAWQKWREEIEKAVELGLLFDKSGITDPADLKLTLEGFKADISGHIEAVKAFLQESKEMKGLEGEGQSRLGKWVASYKTGNDKVNGLIQSIAGPYKGLHAATASIKKLVDAQSFLDANMAYEKELLPAAERCLEIIKGIGAVADDALSHIARLQERITGPVKKAQGEVFKPMEEILALIRKAAFMTSEGFELQARGMKITSAAMAIGGAVLALLLGILITGSITRPMKKAMEGLKQGAEQVESAAAQVASSGQSLAEGASEQASALEQTSSALEEMSSMTKRNAESAMEANRIMGGAKEVVGKADRSMDLLTSSMNEISKAGEETGKIIKTIDEIAFQTNLLALNAAVEAARAGEAGAGFAVVADEVRSLAMRAAEAAKTTATLIEGTLARVKEGAGHVEESNKAFKKVAKAAAKVAELVAQISEGSSEQSQGIEQISRAISELDKVTQQNAAAAEQSASAAQQMSSQAVELKSMLTELSLLVGGGAEKTEKAERLKTAEAAAMTRARDAKVYLPSKGLRNEKLLPLEENDMKEF